MKHVIITPSGIRLDVAKMEAAADRVVALLDELGLTREEAASVAMTIAGNHLVATNATEERAGLAAIGIYRWRARVGFPGDTAMRVLVRERLTDETKGSDET